MYIGAARAKACRRRVPQGLNVCVCVCVYIIYVSIYLYMCVCVCVYFVDKLSAAARRGLRRVDVVCLKANIYMLCICISVYIHFIYVDRCRYIDVDIDIYISR